MLVRLPVLLKGVTRVGIVNGILRRVGFSDQDARQETLGHDCLGPRGRDDAESHSSYQYSS